MIKLRVEEYCHNCPDFDPELRDTVYDYNRETVYAKRIVCCRKEKRCREIAHYLKYGEMPEKPARI